MINSMQKALIKKDIKSITSNKRLFSVMLIVPLVMTIVLPSIFMLTVAFTPQESNDFQSMLSLLPEGVMEGDLQQMMISLLLNNIIPLFFLMIPIMAASVMAASSFVGEKEKRTLETLLYSPMTLKEIYHAKILASFLLSMIVSIISFLVMFIVTETEIWFITGGLILPSINWLILMVLVSPAVSLASITLIVRGSAKAQTVEESQQRGVFLIMPIILLAVGQFTGLISINVWILLGIGAILALIAWIFMKKSFESFNYEMLLK